MRFWITAIFLAMQLSLFAQTSSQLRSKADTIQLIRNTVKLYDLDFTDAEADSMLENVKQYADNYKALHKTLPTNDIPYPFAFNPLPYGETLPTKQQKIVWDIPNNIYMPANKNELAFYSIMQLAGLIKNKRITSVELTKIFIDRLKKWGDTLESVITLTEDLAMQQAKQADDEIKKGNYKGPLHGIPYGLKDLFAVKGYKTTWGTTPYKDQMIDEDSYVYTQLKKAGAVLCAKLSLGALAFNNKWFGGETKNPWNLKQGSSGSSAGSAASVVAGLLPFTVGTETLGSIVSHLKGTDGKDAGALDHAFNYNPKIDLSKLKIAYAENYFKRLTPDAPERKVLDVYKSLGANVQPVVFPDSIFYPTDIIGIILNAESAAAFDELTRTNRDDLIERQDKGFWPNSFRSARTIPAVEYINANRYRYNLCKNMYAFMKNYDVLIVPTFGGSQLRITNLTGNPVVCMPIGFNSTGGPVSITLIGKLYDEATILAAAKAYQDKTNFNKQHPAKFMN